MAHDVFHVSEPPRVHIIWPAVSIGGTGISPWMPTSVPRPVGVKWVGSQQEVISLVANVVKVGRYEPPLFLPVSQVF